MLKRRFYISIVFLCVVHAERTAYPATVHQQADAQSYYRESSQTDQEDSHPAQSQSYSVVDNSAYEGAISPGLVPQDAIQQYLAHSGHNGVSYPPLIYHHQPARAGQPAGFTIQTGYEGYLVPAEEKPPATVEYLRSLMPSTRSFLSFFRAVGDYLIRTVGFILAGGSVTALLCNLTPFCRLTFMGLPFLTLRESAKSVSKVLANEITEERVKRAAELVKMALDKFQNMQPANEEEEGEEDEEEEKEKEKEKKPKKIQ